MTDATVAVDGLEALEIGLNFAAKITLDGELAGGDGVDELVELLRGEILGPDIGIDVGLIEDLFGGAGSDPVNVRKGGFDSLVPWYFDS